MAGERSRKPWTGNEPVGFDPSTFLHIFRRDNTVMTCKRCQVPMREIHGHICHGNRKWRCPVCKRTKMQAPKKERSKYTRP